MGSPPRWGLWVLSDCSRTQKEETRAITQSRLWVWRQSEVLLGTYTVGDLAHCTASFVKAGSTGAAQGHPNLCVFSYLSLGAIV